MVLFNSDYCLRHCTDNGTMIKGISRPIPKMPERPISLVGAAAFCQLTQKKPESLCAFALSVYKIDQALAAPEPTTADPDLNDSIWKLIPLEYHDYIDSFKKSNAERLPPHRPYNHKITLKEGFQPPFGPLYSLSKPELEALRKWLNNNLLKGFICASSLPAEASILFVRKRDGTL